MPGTRERSRRKKAAPRKLRSPSAVTLRALVRPIVKECVAEELAKIEDRLDAQDAAEALREPGEVSHEEFWKPKGL